MKTIQIKKASTEQTKNIICINGEYFEYSSKREMNRVNARINAKINEWLIELNELYITIFTEYRRAWFLMRTRRGNNARSETIITTHLAAIEDRFNHLTNHSQGGYVIFIDLRKICMFMIIICHELENVNRQKNNTMAKHIAMIANKRINQILSEINTYKPI